MVVKQCLCGLFSFLWLPLINSSTFFMYEFASCVSSHIKCCSNLCSYIYWIVSISYRFIGCLWLSWIKLLLVIWAFVHLLPVFSLFSHFLWCFSQQKVSVLKQCTLSTFSLMIFILYLLQLLHNEFIVICVLRALIIFYFSFKFLIHLKLIYIWCFFISCETMRMTINVVPSCQIYVYTFDVFSIYSKA